MDELVRLKAVGDIMLGDHPVCYGHGVSSSIELYGFDYLFENIKTTLNDCDILFGNLESVLSNQDKIENNLTSCELRGKPVYCEILKTAGFDVLAFANNHATQHGVNAFYDTVENININNMFCLGMDVDGWSNVFSYKNSNVDLAMIGFSLRKDKYLNGDLPYAFGDETKILQQVSSLRGLGKTVVVSLHWGEEYLHYPSASQIAFGHKVIDSGASLLLGHHPHVLQGIERYNEGYIVYSLGNFVFDKWQKPQKETMLLDCSLSRNGVERISAIPVLIGDKYQPCLAKGADRRNLEMKIEQYSENVADNSTENYSEQVRNAYLKFRLQSYLYFLKNIHKYKKWVIWQSFTRFMDRRLNN